MSANSTSSSSEQGGSWEPEGMLGEGSQDINARVIALYKNQSALYLRDEVDRLRYFKRHPTFFACLKCMDGRVEFPSMTKSARGLVKPYRAVGGKFEMFWPAFQNSIAFWMKQAIMHAAHSCVFVTSHICSLKRELGCKGWNYDAAAARAHMERLSVEMTEDFGEQLVAIPTTVDTAFDNLILHGPRGDISGESLAGHDIDSIPSAIRQVFPNMPSQVIADLAPFLLGNATRVAELKTNPRSIHQLEHDECIIAIGEGFDGLATDNFAFMNSDVNPNLDSALVLAAKMIEKKIINRPPNDQAAIFTNIFFANSRGILASLPGMDKRCAIRRSRGLQEFAQMHVRKHCPGLWESGRLHFLTAITREPTRELEVVEQGRVS